MPGDRNQFMERGSNCRVPSFSPPTCCQLLVLQVCRSLSFPQSSRGAVRSPPPPNHQTSPLPNKPGVQHAYAFLAGELFGPVSSLILVVCCSRSVSKNFEALLQESVTAHRGWRPTPWEGWVPVERAFCGGCAGAWVALWTVHYARRPSSQTSHVYVNCAHY